MQVGDSVGLGSQRAELVGDQVIGVTAHDQDGYLVAQLRDSQLILLEYDSRNQLRFSRPLNTFLRETEPKNYGEITLPLPMLVQRGHLYIAWGSRLLEIGPSLSAATPPLLPTSGVGPKVTELPRQITGLIGSPAHASPCMVITCDMGAQLIYPLSRTIAPQAFAQGLENPQVCFLRSGHIIAVGSGVLQVYRSIHGKLELEYAESMSEEACQVVASPDCGCFAVLYYNGDIEVFGTTGE